MGGLASLPGGVEAEAALAALAGLAVLSAALALFWPYLSRDGKAARLRRFREERERVRLRARAALGASGRRGPAEPASPLKRMLARFRGLGDGTARRQSEAMAQLARTLRAAGWRDPSAVSIYLAAQVAGPVVAALGALAWAHLLANPSPEPMTEIAAVIGAAIAGYFAPRIYVKNQLTKRRTAILKAWPDTLDLMLICIEAGMTVETALGRVAEEMAGAAADLAAELNLTTAELSYLQDRAQALRNLGERTGLYSVRSAVSAMIQSEQYGTSLATALRVIAQEQRDQRLIDAEKKAAALPPKLTVPMIVFFLPALFVVILAPAAIRFMQN